MQDTANTKVMAAMSGGVDSSVCALLLKEAGLEVAGVTCRMFDSLGPGDANGGEPDAGAPVADALPDDVDDARQACEQLGIAHYVLDCVRPFRDCVIAPFVDSYLGAQTPNPCVDCNRRIKFGVLGRECERLGFDKLATGHYARLDFDDSVGRWRIRRALHAAKDQSYMLCQLSQEQLSRAMFPLGELTKDEVRAMAERTGLAAARRSDSQDICFVPDGDYASFVERWSGRNSQPGPIADVSGKVIGEHAGLLHYTVGQRKGIGIAAPEPLYVLAKDAASNTLVVGFHDELMTDVALAGDVNFVSIPETREFRAQAKTSYRQEPKAASVIFDGEALRVVFDEKITRPAPGQAIALYDIDTGQTLLAGATIMPKS